MEFNVGRHEQVDALHRLVREPGLEILDGPDPMKLRVVHMPLLEREIG